ncbi:MAG TPA: alpha-hydroxy-acid oxidizing protein [Pontiella sp.]
MSEENLTLEEVRQRAKGKLKGVCMVYKDCDGAPSRFCQNQSYGGPLGIGGAGSGASFHNNWLALRRVNLKLRPIGDCAKPDTSMTLFGKKISMPIMAAPVAGTGSFGGDEVITEEDFCNAVIDGSNMAGVIGWRGDSHAYSFDNTPCLTAIAKGGQGGVKIVKPRSQSDIMQFFELAEKSGVTAVGVDVDGHGSYMMNKHGQPVFRKSKADLEELVNATSLPVIFKGIMCAEDAVEAAEAGAAAVVVSNHGGRVMDATPGAADVIPEVVKALKGSNTLVLADGAVRTGYDALKMLALGASAVLVGRDIVRAAVGAGAEGVRIQMEHFQKTFAQAMLMSGCKTLDDISSDILAESSES